MHMLFLSIQPSDSGKNFPVATEGPWSNDFVNFKGFSPAFQEDIFNFIQAVHPLLICKEINCFRVIINYWPRENELQVLLTLFSGEQVHTDRRYIAVLLPNHFYFCE